MGDRHTDTGDHTAPFLIYGAATCTGLFAIQLLQVSLPSTQILAACSPKTAFLVQSFSHTRSGPGTKQNSQPSSSPNISSSSTPSGRSQTSGSRSRSMSASPSPLKASSSLSLPPIHVFDYTSPRVGNEIHIQTKNRLSRVIDCVAERETPMQVACALSREGGKVASVRYYDCLRDGMNLEFMCAFRLLPYVRCSHHFFLSFSTNYFPCICASHADELDSE